jgi:hypothetical protein
MNKHDKNGLKFVATQPFTFQTTMPVDFSQTVCFFCCFNRFTSHLFSDFPYKTVLLVRLFKITFNVFRCLSQHLSVDIYLHEQFFL